MKTEITYCRASSNKDLHQILALQKENLPQNISNKEKQKEGFVTVHHTFDVLNAMNIMCSHVIAKSNDEVIAYALCMHPDFAHAIEVLKPMFKEINKTSKNENYIVMGQICVSKLFRKKGVFRGLYTTMSESLKTTFDRIITEVDVKNTRSLNAHYAVGFKDLKTYHSGDQDWKLITLEL